MNAAAAAPADDFEAACARGLADLGRERSAAAATTLSAQFDALETTRRWPSCSAGPDGRVETSQAPLGRFEMPRTSNPAMVPAYLALASTYRDLGQNALAVQALESGLRQLPGSPELQAMLAEVKK